MKNICHIILLIAVITLTACTESYITDSDVTDVHSDDVAIVPTDSDSFEGVYVSIPEPIDGNAANGETVGAVTRSSAVYNPTKDKMMFSWGADNSEAYACVFSLNKNVTESPYDAVKPQVFTRIAGQDTTALSCRFVGPNGVKALDQKDVYGNIIDYVSFRPYPEKTKEFNYQKKEISYEGQCNSKNVKMTKYFNNDNASYTASEKEASSHLGAYDFLVSGKTNADAGGNVSFKLNRVGVFARFYIKCPAEDVFEELQLVSHNTELFTLTGTMDLSADAITITPTKQSNVITLSYDYDASDATNHPGLDMTDKESNDYYDEYPTDTYTGYIVSYMVLPPVDLKTAVPTGSTNTVYLYLVSHTKGDPTVKKYYKSLNLSTPKLTSNMLYKWTAVPTEDTTPITFAEVTVQQWKDDTSVDNSEKGSGTIGW